MTKQTKQSSGSSPLSLHIGDDVFYQHPEFGKCSARCTVPSDGSTRDPATGRLTNTLIVFTPEGTTEKAVAAYDSGRSVGTWDTKQPGD